MLQSLLIKDFIIISHLEVSFEMGFTSITGETGAGKSIFVGALSLLMGRRADSSLIRDGAEKSIIEGLFTDIPYEIQEMLHTLELESGDNSECILRREISKSGKNRSFVNDTPVPLSTMEKIAERLIDIHSQHSNLLLGNSLYILSAIDKMLSDSTPLEKYQKVYRDYKRAQNNLIQLRQQLKKASEEYDYDHFRFQEISVANPQANEEDTLQEEEKLLQYADSIKEGLLGASQCLERSETDAIEALHKLATIVEKLPSSEEYVERIKSCQIELRDIATDFQRRSEAIEADPQRLAEVEERLNLLHHLLDKYHCTSTKELVDFQQQLQQRIELFQDGDLTLKNSEREVQELKIQLNKVAATLTKARKSAVTAMEEAIKNTLKSMELPLAEVSFQLEPSEEPKPTGYDEVNFLFAANNKLPLKPVGEIASGGEMSRLMLALKALLAEKGNLPSILFDEIDTGISGRIADKMGKILRQMGSTMQVIAITHLPQIAARGKFQKNIEKHLDSTGAPITSLRSLSEEERIKEVAALLSGNTITQESIGAAKVLLKNND